MFNDTDFSHERRNEHLREQNSTRVAAYARWFPEGRSTCFGPGDEEQWYGSLAYKSDGGCTATAENMMNKADVQCSGAQAHHPGECWEAEEAEDLQYTFMQTWARRRWWLLKTIIAVSQLSIYGVVAKWCNTNGAQETVQYQEFYDPPPGRVTQLTRHETLDLVEMVRRNPLRQVDKQELASGKQQCPKSVRELASQTSVEEGQHFVARSALLSGHHKHMWRLHHTLRRSQSRTKRCVRRQHQHRTTSQRAGHSDIMVDTASRFWLIRWRMMDENLWLSSAGKCTQSMHAGISAHRSGEHGSKHGSTCTIKRRLLQQDGWWTCSHRSTEFEASSIVRMRYWHKVSRSLEEDDCFLRQSVPHRELRRRSSKWYNWCKTFQGFSWIGRLLTGFLKTGNTVWRTARTKFALSTDSINIIGTVHEVRLRSLQRSAHRSKIVEQRPNTPRIDWLHLSCRISAGRRTRRRRNWNSPRTENVLLHLRGPNEHSDTFFFASKKANRTRDRQFGEQCQTPPYYSNQCPPIAWSRWSQEIWAIPKRTFVYHRRSIETNAAPQISLKQFPSMETVRWDPLSRASGQSNTRNRPLRSDDQAREEFDHPRHSPCPTTSRKTKASAKRRATTPSRQ